MLSGTDVSWAHDGRLGRSRWYGWWREDCSICRGRPLRRHAFRYRPTDGKAVLRAERYDVGPDCLSTDGVRNCDTVYANQIRRNLFKFVEMAPEKIIMPKSRPNNQWRTQDFSTGGLMPEGRKQGPEGRSSRRGLKGRERIGVLGRGESSSSPAIGSEEGCKLSSGVRSGAQAIWRFCNIVTPERSWSHIPRNKPEWRPSMGQSYPKHSSQV